MNAAAVDECLRLLGDFEFLLREEREALSRGDLPGAARAARAKEGIIARLRELDLEELGAAERGAAASVEALRAAQDENVSLLRDMAAGVAGELSALRARRRTLGAYGERTAADGAAFMNGQA